VLADVAATAALACVGSYAIVAAGEAQGVPLAEGLYNRVGMFAGAAAAVLVVGVAATAVEALPGGRRAAGAAAVDPIPATVALCLATLVGWGRHRRVMAVRSAAPCRRRGWP
jgi:hypothetical protein